MRFRFLLSLSILLRTLGVALGETDGGWVRPADISEEFRTTRVGEWLFQTASHRNRLRPFPGASLDIPATAARYQSFYAESDAHGNLVSPNRYFGLRKREDGSIELTQRVMDAVASGPSPDIRTTDRFTVVFTPNGRLIEAFISRIPSKLRSSRCVIRPSVLKAVKQWGARTDVPVSGVDQDLILHPFDCDNLSVASIPLARSVL